MRHPLSGTAALRVGVISDTHGLLRPEAIACLDGSDHIIHGGDIGDPAILQRLSAIAPVTAVRGNNDQAPWAMDVPETVTFRLGAIDCHALHDLSLLDIDPSAAGIRVVVCGHSHRPRIEWRDGVLYLNPGSAGPRRFTLPICLAELTVVGQQVDARIVPLA